MKKLFKNNYLVLFAFFFAFGQVDFVQAFQAVQDEKLETEEKQSKEQEKEEKPSPEKAQQQEQEQKLFSHETLNGVLWMQTSLEYSMSCRQIYSFATMQLDNNLADNSYTAALEQTSDRSELPPAVILDVDETVLDNSPFQARLAAADGSFNDEDWNKWVMEANAKAIPGAADFVRHAKEKGVEIIFVTNRSAEQEEKTIENLDAVLGITVSKEKIHCKYEKEEWGSNKSSRRQHVCQSYRVIAMVGDDFNDFAWLGKTSPEDRIAIGNQFSSHWSTGWFLLPNPLYGNWEKALYDYDYSKNREDVLELKYNLLDAGK